MIKLVIKLALAALIANAVWRVGSAYTTFFRFKDAISQSTQFSHGRSDEDVQQRIIELARQYDVVLPPGAFTVRRSDKHIYTEGEYTQDIDFAPGFSYPWTFKWETDTYVVVPTKLDPSETK